jgi:UDP-N-acetylmuramoyl-L-alanyl-D-glutamate--2,6-diaminopimelate ligase
VFGCGGGRDHGKRPMMGKIAEQHAHHSILTNDNPRDEDPEDILEAIAKFMHRDAYVKVTDRQKAIFQAILQAKIGDIVLIAGKGHEEYQEISGVRYPFSDVLEVEKALIYWEKQHELASF